ncbi:alpha/beta hydrolase [Oleiagrimonas sp. C23AA]|uniref:alpha/beta fold hydrolase n=1 Tax=Oleiagrimonas sp. C23AA TaxID=2719047 RepID=UPI001423AFED|nr:alpha/beta hydrolase [Oleiagrimonas sp. C23AA]NII09540.1 alpha/beta hydrolase [Oleiagrimonas sp. C23AA]
MTPMVLVPGLLCTADVFAPQLPALWQHGPVTIASTLKGRSMAQMAASILASAPPQFALGGISMGGYLAFEILRQAPDRVTALALISTSPLPDTPEQSQQRRDLLALARRSDFAAVLRRTLRGLLHPDHRDDSELLETQVRMGLAVGIEAMERQQQAIMERHDSRPLLADIHVPAAVIVGDGDPLTPPEVARDMTQAIPRAELSIIETCGHASTREQPEAVNQALERWLQRVSSA